MLLACGAAYRIPKKRRKSEVTISTAKGFEREKTESILMQTWLMTGGVGRQELAFDQRDEEHDITHSTLPSLPNVELSPRGLTN
jgi:dihydrodipicolinate reductase